MKKLEPSTELERGIQLGKEAAWDILKEFYPLYESGKIILTFEDVLWNMTPDKLKEIINVYKESRIIQNGDIVENKYDSGEWIVLNADKGHCVTTDLNFVRRDCNFKSDDWEKTGKHVDIDGLVKIIKED